MFPLNIHTISHNDKAVITASSLLGYDATSLAHMYLGSFSPSSLQILSSSVRLEGEWRCTAIFRSLEMFDRVQARAPAGPLKDIQRLVPKPLVHCLGCVLTVIVLLEGQSSNQKYLSHAPNTTGIVDLTVKCLLTSP